MSPIPCSVHLLSLIIFILLSSTGKPTGTVSASKSLNERKRFTSTILLSIYSAFILPHHSCVVWHTTKNIGHADVSGEYFSPVTIHHHDSRTWESNYELTGHELRRMLFRLAISVQSFGFLPITTLRMQPLKLSLVPNVPLGAPSGNTRRANYN